MMDYLIQEQSLLGDLLIAPEILAPVRGIVNEDEFSSDFHRMIFRAACDLQDGGQPVDIVPIGEELARMGWPGHTKALADLMAITPTALNWEAHAEAVHRAGMARRLRGVLSEAVEALDGGQDPETVCGNVQAQLDTIAASAASGGLIDGPQAFADLMEYRGGLEAGERRAVVRTGFKALDDALGGGLGAGWMAVLAARPSCGKTTFALNVAEYVARTCGAVLFTSMEETTLSLTAKRVGLAAYLQPARLLNEGHLPDDESDRLAEAAVEMSQRPLFMTTERNLTVSRLKFLARQITGLGLVVVDYLQLLEPAGGRTRYEQITGISRELKLAALELGVPFLVLCKS